MKGMFDVSYTVLLIIEWISNSHGICCDIIDMGPCDIKFSCYNAKVK